MTLHIERLAADESLLVIGQQSGRSVDANSRKRLEARIASIADKLRAAIRPWSMVAEEMTLQHFHFSLCSAFEVYHRHRNFFSKLAAQYNHETVTTLRQCLVKPMIDEGRQVYERLRRLGKLRAGVTSEVMDTLIRMTDNHFFNHLNVSNQRQKEQVVLTITHILWHSLHYGKPRKRLTSSSTSLLPTTARLSSHVRKHLSQSLTSQPS